MLTSWWTAFLNIIFPPKCPVCKTGVDRHGAWCPKCLAPVLAERWINLAGHGLASLDSCRVVCFYQGGIRRLIHNMKFHHAENSAAYLAWILQKRAGLDQFPLVDAVVPVPLHPMRLKERGYNQTELIFRPWARQNNLAWMPALARAKPTIPQWELHYQERRQNIKDAFIVTRPETVARKNILLVDDIFTTGITMNECAAVLKRAGAARVDGLALAGGAQ